MAKEVNKFKFILNDRPFTAIDVRTLSQKVYVNEY